MINQLKSLITSENNGTFEITAFNTTTSLTLGKCDWRMIQNEKEENPIVLQKFLWRTDLQWGANDEIEIQFSNDTGMNIKGKHGGYQAYDHPDGFMIHLEGSISILSVKLQNDFGTFDLEFIETLYQSGLEAGE